MQDYISCIGQLINDCPNFFFMRYSLVMIALSSVHPVVLAKIPKDYHIYELLKDSRDAHHPRIERSKKNRFLQLRKTLSFSAENDHVGMRTGTANDDKLLTFRYISIGSNETPSSFCVRPKPITHRRDLPFSCRPSMHHPATASMRLLFSPGDTQKFFSHVSSPLVRPPSHAGWESQWSDWRLMGEAEGFLFLRGTRQIFDAMTPEGFRIPSRRTGSSCLRKRISAKETQEKGSH